ncbi:MAG TPA: hypothetical protein VFP59_16850 [Candidatus Angelobacter sp.]|nr:hypothetical protein [Candidatus Angelobacter sp.]
MTDYIPFINSQGDCEIATSLYSDAVAFRISLESAEKHCPLLPSGPKRWIDAAIDGLHHDLGNLSASYAKHVTHLTGYQEIVDPAFQAAPKTQVVATFVKSALDLCLQHAADWVSVPQLPIVGDASRNKINKSLAGAARAWKQQTGFTGKLILPVIFTNQKQINKKTERTKKLSSVSTCYKAALADGVWVVDSSLNDQDASDTFNKRFSELIKLHKELNEKLLDDAITVAGPYWGMNLVMWARGLVRYPAIGLGTGYRYSIPGIIPSQGKTRVALGPLRRWASAKPELKEWLSETVKSLAADPINAAEFSSLEKDFSHLLVKKHANVQIAKFYRNWFQKFAALPPSGRALALYHDLSSSYVLAKGLEELPEEGTARRPERIQQQLMMNCL